MMHSAKSRHWSFALFAFLLLSFSAPTTADERQNVVSPEVNYLGLSYGQWAAFWWQWVFSIPDGSHHPFFPNGDVLQHQAGQVWFLAGRFIRATSAT